MWGWCWLASLFSSLPQKNLPPLLPSPRSYFFLFTRLTHLGFFFFLSFLLPFICRYQSTDPEQAYVDEMAHKLAMMQVQGTAQAAVLASQGQMMRGLQGYSAHHQQHGGGAGDPSQMMGGGGGYGGGGKGGGYGKGGGKYRGGGGGGGGVGGGYGGGYGGGKGGGNRRGGGHRRGNH
jgi:hypothetical protein